MSKIIKFGNVAYATVNAVPDVELSAIDIPDDRARSFDPEEAKALAFIIAATGLQNPIRVRAVGNRFRLIAGRKRLEAFRLLEWDSIPATISTVATDDEARLEEVMENLGRVELNKLDRCQHLYELKQVYERMHPEISHGGDRKSAKIKIRNPELDPTGGEIFGFVETTALKIGLSRSVIAEAVKIWTDLRPEIRKRLAGTWIANRQSALKELSEQSPVAQQKVVDLLLTEPPAAKTVADAVAIFRNGTAPTAAEKKVAAVSKAVQSMAKPVAASLTAATDDASRLATMKEGIATLSKFLDQLKDEELDSVVVAHEERIIASLKRRGRI